MNADQWVEVFQAVGLNQSMMHCWHHEFERRYPEQHESFLKWLELSAADIQRIREKARSH